MAAGKWMAALAAGYLAYVGYGASCRYRALHRHKEVGKDVHRWEGEGGNVPEVETVTPPPPSDPLGGAAARPRPGPV